MIRRLLQQQFLGCGGTAPAAGRFLQISSTFSYESNPSAAACADKIGRMWVNGDEILPAASFRVTMNNFLATGGDGFTASTRERTRLVAPRISMRSSRTSMPRSLMGSPSRPEPDRAEAVGPRTVRPGGKREPCVT